MPNPQPFHVTFGKQIRKDTRNFIFLAYLGSGAEGLVWLATTGSGTGCVVKISMTLERKQLTKYFNHGAERDSLTSEAVVWKTVWGVDARVESVGGQPGLIIPYFKMCEPGQPNEPQYRSAALQAIHTMVGKGYRHDDLTPRHVGFYLSQDETLNAVFIDLSGSALLRVVIPMRSSICAENLGSSKCMFIYFVLSYIYACLPLYAMLTHVFTQAEGYVCQLGGVPTLSFDAKPLNVCSSA